MDLISERKLRLLRGSWKGHFISQCTHPALNYSTAHVAVQLVFWIQRPLIRGVCTSLTKISDSSTLVCL